MSWRKPLPAGRGFHHVRRGALVRFRWAWTAGRQRNCRPAVLVVLVVLVALRTANPGRCGWDPKLRPASPSCFYCSKHQENLCSDLLFNNGAYAEYIRIPRRIVETNMLAIPKHVSFEEAAMVEPLACVLRGLHETKLEIGDSVAVIGAGPIGLMFVQVAKLAGCNVISVVKRESQVGPARRLGADSTVLIASVDDPVKAVRRLTPEARGCDVVRSEEERRV